MIIAWVNGKFIKRENKIFIRRYSVILMQSKTVLA